MMSIFDNGQIEMQEEETEILTEDQIAAIMEEGLELMARDIANGEYPTYDSWPTPEEIADFEREQFSLRAARTYVEGE